MNRIVTFHILMISIECFCQLQPFNLGSVKIPESPELQKKGSEFERTIYSLPVDSSFDTTAFYMLRYTYHTGWSEYLEYRNFAEYKAGDSALISGKKLFNQSQDFYDIREFRYVTNTTDELYKKIVDHSVLYPLNLIVCSANKYVVLIHTSQYIGNRSYSSTSYLFYQKVD